jgi:molybdopterin molybdotransferase
LIVLGDELQTGMVRDAFMPSLPAAIRAAGAMVTGSMQCRDDPDSTVSAMASAPGDLLITTGGTSHGPTDFARSSLITLGARLLFDGVAVRPGHPVILAELPDGRLVLCLPGNPLAAMLCFASFAMPLLDGAAGRRPTASAPVSVDAAIVNDSSSTRLVPCVVHGDGARATGWQGPGMLRGLAAADAVAVVPAGGVPAGTWAATLPLPW